MVFVHEWTSMPDGNGLMCYAPLSDDFTHFIEEPKTMFKDGIVKTIDWYLAHPEYLMK